MSFDNQQIEIICGKGSVPVHIPRKNHGKTLKLTPWNQLKEPALTIKQALENPIQSAPLATLAAQAASAVILVSDITRPVPNSILLPPILSTLEDAGIPREAILILVATGMHRPNQGEELSRLLGPEIANSYRIENHFGTEEPAHKDLGFIGDGVRLCVDRRFLDAELKIATGLIEPHLLAGYSGGRKSIVPGICSLETMKSLHGYQMLQHPDCRAGELDKNRFHLTALEGAKRAGLDFLVNVTLNTQNQMTGVFAGELDAAHRAGVQKIEQHCTQTLEEPLPIVITGAGGYPLDLTLYQNVHLSLPSMHKASLLSQH